MHRYTPRHEDDLRLPAPIDDAVIRNSLRDWMDVINGRLQAMCECIEQATLAVRDLSRRIDFLEGKVGDLSRRIDILEDKSDDAGRQMAVLDTRIRHTASKPWLLTGVVAATAIMVAGTIGGFWWITQHYLAPLLRTSAG